MTFVATVALCTSCTNDPIVIDGVKGTLSFNLECQAMDVVSRTEAGNPDYNENSLRKLIFVFYEEGKTTSYVTDDYSITENIVTVGIDSSIDVEGTTKYTIYVVANSNHTKEDLKNKSIEDIKALSATELTYGQAQDSFVMDGQSENAIDLQEDVNNGTIKLYRSCAKIMLQVDVKDQITKDENTYTSVGGKMQVKHYNGIANGKIDGTAEEPEIFSSPTFIAIEEGANKHVPFYSYPISWRTNDNYKNYLTLMVQWKAGNTGDFIDYYYKIPVYNEDINEFLRNHLYRIVLNVSILGGTSEEAPVVLEPTFIIQDWSTLEVSASLNDYKYLVLDTYSDNLYSQNTYYLGYTTSNDIDFSNGKTRITSITYPTYDQKGIKTIKNENTANATITIDEETGKLKINHNIPTNYVPYTITAEVWNKDGIKQTFELVQYPPIYIEGFTSNGHVIINKQGYYQDEVPWDKNSINSSRSGSNNYDYLTVRDPYNDIYNEQSSTNMNRSTYTITVTVLGDAFPYKIGDPRDNETTIDITEKNNGTNSYLTRPTKSKIDDIIAPAYKMASSYGKVHYSMDWEDAKKRCASYEEDGYPVGRWRLPTVAEIEFAVNLQQQKTVYLYSSDSDAYYWSSTNGVAYSATKGKGNNMNSAFTRCVYDVWYWGEERDENAPSYSSFVSYFEEALSN